MCWYSWLVVSCQACLFKDSHTPSFTKGLFSSKPSVICSWSVMAAAWHWLINRFCCCVFSLTSSINSVTLSLISHRGGMVPLFTQDVFYFSPPLMFLLPFPVMDVSLLTEETLYKLPFGCSASVHSSSSLSSQPFPSSHHLSFSLHLPVQGTLAEFDRQLAQQMTNFDL